MFANRDECFAAVLEESVATVAVELSAAGLKGLQWRERVRMGVWGILAFCDLSRRWRECVWCRRCAQVRWC